MEVIRDDYVCKIEAVKILQKAYTEGRIKAKDGCVSILHDLNALPKADVQPVKHGRWVRTDKSMGVETVYACSECGYQVRESDRTNYCGDCGSKLDIIYQDDKVTAVKVTEW